MKEDANLQEEHRSYQELSQDYNKDARGSQSSSLL